MSARTTFDPLPLPPRGSTMAAHSLAARSFASPSLSRPATRAPAIASDWDGVQFKVIFAFCLAFYLAAAMLARLDPRSWRRGAARRSVFVEAWEASGPPARIAFAG